jgi:CPA2 family monovalent cation:H+ antiporter-2
MAIDANSVIQDLAVIMVVSSVMAIASSKLRQPLILGYIIAGILVGPHVPPNLILDPDVVNVFAQIGIILLLFVVGLEFPVRRLREIGRKATIIASIKVGGVFAVSYLVTFALGFSLYDRLYIALAVSVTSTVIALKILEGFGAVREQAASLIVAISIIEDIIVVSALALLQSTALKGTVSLLQLAESSGLVVAFILGVILIGSRTIPKLINYVAKSDNQELLLISMLGVAFGVAILGSNLGISVATGSFLAGVVVAESKAVEPARIISRPLRDMFSAIFFVSMGALMNITLIFAFIVPALVLVAASIAMKFALTVSAATVQGYQRSTALKIGVGLSSTGGEMSFVVAKGGADVAATSPFVLPMIGTITLITTFLSPYIIKKGWQLVTYRWTEPESNTPAVVSVEPDLLKAGQDATFSIGNQDSNAD